MRKGITLLVMAVLATIGAMSQTTKKVTFDFRNPATIDPPTAPPVVPENPDDRESFHENNINGVVFSADGVTLVAEGGLHNEGETPRNFYSWRKGYDDNGVKRTENTSDGSYYLNLRMSDTDDVVAADPTQKLVVTLKAPQGYVFRSIDVQGWGKGNSARYLKPIDESAGSFADPTATYMNTFTVTNGLDLSEIRFTVPRKRADGVNISGCIVSYMDITLEQVAEPEPEGLPLPYNRKFKNLDDMTVIDSNGDGYTWKYYLSKARCTMPLGDDNPAQNSDDWLITPGLAMYGGKYYKVYNQMVANSFPGKLEVKLGKAPTTEAMTIDVMPLTEFTGRRDCIDYVKVSETGTYYLGLHALTTRDEGCLYLDCKGIDVFAPMEPTVPGDVTDLKYSPSSDGVKPYKVTISFKAPTVDLDGNPLTENMTVKVGYGTYVGDALGSTVKTFTDVAPGQELECVYSQKSTGNKTFGIICSNGSGDGKETYFSCYVGVNKPGDPTDLTVTETDTPGEVVLSWNAPENDVDGNPINADLIRYHLTDGVTYRTIEQNVTGTSFTYQTGLADTQKFFNFYIVAETDGGKTLSVGSPYFAVGKSIATPLTEGFDRLKAIPLNFTANDGVAKIFHDADMSGVKKPYSAEGDGYYATLYAYSDKARPSMLTGKISLDGLASPVLTFDIFAPEASDGTRLFLNNEVVVKARTLQGEFAELGKVKIGDLPSTGWNRIVYPLADFAGKEVQFYFEGTLNDYPNGENSQSFLFFDRMQVREAPAGTDLAAISLETPAVAEQSYGFNVTAYVENDGATTVDDAVVELYRNGEKVDVKELPDIAAGRIEMVTFEQTLNATHGTDVAYKALILSDTDDNEANDSTEEKCVNYKTSMHPAPESLTGTSDKDAVTLTWSEPTLPGGTAQPFTESFEIEGTLAVDELEGWTFYDLDKGTLGLPTGFTVEGLTEGATQYAWIIADESLFNATGMAHSGTHFMTGFFNYDSRTNNDVAVSPELNGEAQTISLWAVSMASKYPETIDIWYSTDTRAIDDFKLLSRIDYVPAYWSQFDFDLPEGTRFFAIRHVSADAWIVGVDDVTYTPMERGKDIELIGYNVYRDGVKLNKRAVADTSYVDDDVEDGKHTYSVSAVYDKGESLACEPLELTYSTVAAVASDTVSAKGCKGYVHVTSSSDVTVEIYSASGIKVATQQCHAGSVDIPVAPGVYMLRLGTSTQKVMVK